MTCGTIYVTNIQSAVSRNLTRKQLAATGPFDQGGGGGVEPRALRFLDARKTVLIFYEMGVMLASIALWRADGKAEMHREDGQSKDSIGKGQMG